MKPRYNLAPSQPALIVRLAKADGRRRLGLATWGLVPHWSKEAKFPYSTINARVETVDSKPAFRDSFRQRRCLVPCDGWYEWQQQASGKQPYVFRHNDRQPFALAGLWDRRDGMDKGGMLRIETFTILVTAANEATRAIHDRMPVILPADAWGDWLAADTPSQELKGMLAPCPVGLEQFFPVSRAVNSPTNDVTELLNQSGT